jgi:copper oxidase (laccase) domain-containing protein
MTTCSGGTSTGLFSSMNLGEHVGDEPAAVAANRA